MKSGVVKIDFNIADCKNKLIINIAEGGENMANKTINLFDNEVLKRIKLYISMNDLDMNKTAKEAGMTYIQLWSTLNRNKSIKLCDYVALCKAFREPFDAFLPKE